MLEQLAALQSERDNLSEQLYDQAGKSEQWYERTKELERELEQLRLSDARQVKAGSQPVDNDAATRVEALAEPEAADQGKITDLPEALAISSSDRADYPTRKELGNLLGVSHETIRVWEQNGNLFEEGWEALPGTVGRNNPKRYRQVNTLSDPVPGSTWDTKVESFLEEVNRRDQPSD